eukprot:5904416-Pleurochrysis_carterae.AAC.4
MDEVRMHAATCLIALPAATPSMSVIARRLLQSFSMLEEEQRRSKSCKQSDLNLFAWLASLYYCRRVFLSKIKRKPSEPPPAGVLRVTAATSCCTVLD